MEPSLKELFAELTREDQSNFRSEVIRRLCPELHEATERVESKLQAHYESRFEKKNW